MEFHEQVKKLTQDDIPFVQMYIKDFMPKGWAEGCNTLQEVSELIYTNGYEPTVYHHDLEDLNIDVQDKKQELADDLDTTVEVVEKFEDELKQNIKRAMADAERQNFETAYMNKVVKAIAETAYTARRWSGVNSESVVEEVIQEYPDGSEVSFCATDPTDARYDSEHISLQFKLEAVQEELQDWINDNHIDADEINPDVVEEVCDEIAGDLEYDRGSDEYFFGRYYSANFDDWGVHYKDYGYHEVKSEIESYLDEQDTFKLVAILWIKRGQTAEELAESLHSLTFRDEGDRIEIEATMLITSTRRKLMENLEQEIGDKLDELERNFGNVVEVFTVRDDSEFHLTEEDL